MHECMRDGFRMNARDVYDCLCRCLCVWTMLYRTARSLYTVTYISY